MKNQSHFVSATLFVLLTISTLNINAQTGAAGVGTSSSNIIWLDANAMPLANGNAVSSFTDLSGNSNNFTQATSTKRPIFTTNAVNGLPALQYDGVNDVLNSGSIVALQSSNLTYFIVYQRAPLTNQTVIGSNYASSDKKWSSYSTSTNNNIGSVHYSPTAKGVTSLEPGGSFTFISTHITPTTFSIRNKGILGGNMSTPYTVPTGHNKVTLGNLSYTTWQNYTLNGYIAEVIIYNSALTNLQRILIENYLGAKYNMAVPTDLYAYQASHNIGLIALGNNGTNSQTSAQGVGVLELGNAASMTSNEYLLAAHTNDDLDLFTLTDIPVSLAGSQRWTRTWRVDETGDVGNVDVTFHLAGGYNFGSSSSYRLLVDNVTQDGDFTDATVISGTYNGGTQTILFNTDLADGDLFTLAAVDEQLEIHAIFDGVWSDPNTWDCTCVPNWNDDIYIDAYVSVTVDMDCEAGYLSIEEPQGELIMDADFTLSIYEDWDILSGGLVNLTAGRIALVGTSSQYVDAAGSTINFNDLEINNSSGGSVTFYTSQYIINGTLYPNLGNMVMDPAPGNELIINSTSGIGGGRIAEVTSGATITGSVTSRRYIEPGTADVRDLSSPLAGVTLVQWDDNTAISGVGFPDGCAIGNGDTCYYSVKRYILDEYVDVTSIYAPLTSGIGYEMFLGDDLNTFSGVTLDVTGTTHGSSDFVVSVGAEWQIQGNPFVSPISWPSVTKSHVGNYYYIYDSSTGGFEYYDGSDNSSSIPELANGIIAVGQGFWTYDWGWLTYKQADKTSSTATYVRTSERPDLSLGLKLSENASTYSCKIVLQEDIISEDGIDTIYDIRHLSTGIEKAPSFAIYSGEEFIRKNYIKDDLRNKSLDLYTKILNAGYYTIEASNIENFNSYRKVLLFDNQTGEFIDLKTELSYTFYSEITEGQRFTLILTNEEMQTGATIQSLTINEDVVENGLTITQMGHTFNVVSTEDFTEDSQIKLVNVLGQQVVFEQSVKLIGGSNLISIPEEYKGVYVLVITTGNEMVTKKVVL